MAQCWDIVRGTKTGTHACYEDKGHDGVHKCSCGFFWYPKGTPLPEHKADN